MRLMKQNGRVITKIEMHLLKLLGHSNMILL